MPRRRRSNDPRRVEALHRARIEAAVRRHSRPIWVATRRLHARWLRIMLAAAQGAYERLVLEQRARTAVDAELQQRLHDFEVAWLVAELEKTGVSITPEDLLNVGEVQTATNQMASSAPQGAGFLTDDPRTGRLVADAHGILEDQISSYWQSLTDPELLARRLVRQKAEGVPYVEAARQISREYGTEFYRAERLVRSSYNTASNHAHLEAVLEAGFPNKRWLTSRDARVRRPIKSSHYDHASAEGQTVPVEEPFIVSGEPLLYPGDSSRGASIGNCANCKCTIIGVT